MGVGADLWTMGCCTSSVAPIDAAPLGGRVKDGVVYTVDVNVVQARNLANVDRIGKSDPYVVCRLGAFSKRSRTIENKLSPVFQQA
jgi:hypothetical protein